MKVKFKIPLRAVLELELVLEFSARVSARVSARSLVLEVLEAVLVLELVLGQRLTRRGHQALWRKRRRRAGSDRGADSFDANLLKCEVARVSVARANPTRYDEAGRERSRR